MNFNVVYIYTAEVRAGGRLDDDFLSSRSQAGVSLVLRYIPQWPDLWGWASAPLLAGSGE